MAKHTAVFFDSYAHDFANIYGTKNTGWNRLINRAFRKSMRLRFEKTISGCAPIAGKSVLDVGCGPGYYAVALAQQGAATVTGIDFAPAMIDLSREKAAAAGVSDRCDFIVGDYLTHTFDRTFDYAIVMGFMDYIADAETAIMRTLSLTNDKAFFSFPAAAGLLAFQRRLRYRTKCPLFMYSRERLRELFDRTPAKETTIEKIHRDYFVTVSI